MSHFTVAVIVDEAENKEEAIRKAEEMLAPYDENLEVDPYFCMGDRSLGACKLDGDTVSYGYMSTYNPNSKWDWFQVGGRWAGHLDGKDGQQHDVLQFKDIGGEVEPTFAIVHETEDEVVWDERGEMGWFGVVFDEKKEEDWGVTFRDRLYRFGNDDAWLVIVDAHI